MLNEIMNRLLLQSKGKYSRAVVISRLSVGKGKTNDKIISIRNSGSPFTLNSRELFIPELKVTDYWYNFD